MNKGGDNTQLTRRNGQEPLNVAEKPFFPAGAFRYHVDKTAFNPRGI